MSVQLPCVFISHSQKDELPLAFIVNGLKRARIKSWVAEEDIPPNKPWNEAITHAVENCIVVVVILTNNSVESDWVQKETLRAEKLKKSFIVCRFDNAEAPIQVSEFHPLDFRSQPNSALIRLIKALQKFPDFAPSTKALAAENLTLPKVTKRDLQPPPSSSESMPVTPRSLKQHPFFDYLLKHTDGQIARAVAQDLLVWAETTVDDVNFSGQKIPSMHAELWVGSGGVKLFSIKVVGDIPMIEVPFQYLRNTAPFDIRTERLAVIDKLNKLMPPNDHFASDRADGRPSLPIARVLATPENLSIFKAIMNEMVRNIRANAP